MLMLRWSSDYARQLYAYARMGTTAHERLADAAAEVQIDAIRSHTLLGTAAGATAPTGGVTAEQREAAEAV
jgi:hypothetical protein